MTDLPEDMLFAVNEYGFYCVPAEFKNREVPKILFAGGVYEPSTIKLLRRLTKRQGGDIVTGGAFVGDFFPAISECLTAKQRLISFEPNPISYAACSYTAKLNGVTNLDLHPVAVGKEDATLPLQIQRSGGSAMGARAKIAETHTEGETIEVDVKTLDGLLEKSKKVSVLHLDIEDHEEPALWGATETIKRDKPVVILEAGRPWQQRNYLQVLNDICGENAYDFFGAVDRNAVYHAKI